MRILKAGVLASLALASVLSVDAGSAPAKAAVVTWNLNSSTGTLGNSQTYTASAITITAAGFTGPGTATALFGKNDAGDEKGLGLNIGTDHEINLTNFIRIDF